MVIAFDDYTATPRGQLMMELQRELPQVGLCAALRPSLVVKRLILIYFESIIFLNSAKSMVPSPLLSHSFNTLSTLVEPMTSLMPGSLSTSTSSFLSIAPLPSLSKMQKAPREHDPRNSSCS